MNFVKKPVAILLAFLMALPILAIGPIDTTVYAGALPPPPVFDRQNVAFHDNAISLSLSAAGTPTPNPLPWASRDGAFSFDLTLPDIGDQNYVIFPFANNQVIRLDFWRTEPTEVIYDIEVDPDPILFGPVVVGTPVPELPGPRMITIRNTGNQPTGDLTITLPGDAPFEIALTAAGPWGSEIVLESIPFHGPVLPPAFDTFYIRLAPGVNADVVHSVWAYLQIASYNMAPRNVLVRFDVVPPFELRFLEYSYEFIWNEATNSWHASIAIENTGLLPTGPLSIGVAMHQPEGAGFTAFSPFLDSIQPGQTLTLPDFRIIPETNFDPSLWPSVFTGNLWLFGGGGTLEAGTLVFFTSPPPPPVTPDPAGLGIQPFYTPGQEPWDHDTNLHFMLTRFGSVEEARAGRIHEVGIQPLQHSIYSPAGMEGFIPVDAGMLGVELGMITVADFMFPSFAIRPGGGVSFRIGPPAILGETIFHVRWVGNTVTFAIDTIAEDGRTGLLGHGQIHTFEFGHVSAGEGHTVETPRWEARDPSRHLHHAITEIDVNEIMIQQFARDWAMAPPPGAGQFAYAPPQLVWHGGRIFGPPSTEMPHVHLHPDDTAAETLWYENWWENQRVSVTIPMPMAWNEATGRFTTSLRDLTADGWLAHTHFDEGSPGAPSFFNMNVRFDMDWPNSAVRRQLSMVGIMPHVTGDSIPVVQADSNLPTVINIDDEIVQTSVPFVRFDPDNNRMTINIADMDYSMIYDATLSLVGVTEAPVRAGASSTDLIDRIFTFARYSYPDFRDDGYFIELWPYRRATSPGVAVPGEYTIYNIGPYGSAGYVRLPQFPPRVGPPLDDEPPGSVTVFGPPDPVLVPIGGNVGAMNRHFFRVFFQPSDVRDGGMDHMESRPFRLVTRDEDMRIGAPRDFILIDHEMLPIRVYDSETGLYNIYEADLNLHMQWTIADFDLMRRLMLRKWADEGGVPGELGRLTTMQFSYDLQAIMGYEEYEDGTRRVSERFGVVELLFELYRMPDGEYEIRLILYDEPGLQGTYTLTREANAALGIDPFRLWGDPPIPAWEEGRAPGPIVTTDGNVVINLSATVRAERHGAFDPNSRHVFNFPNVFLLYVQTADPGEFPGLNRQPDSDFVAYVRRSLTQLLVLNDFDWPRVMPPQNFILRNQPDPLDDPNFDPEAPRGFATIETSFVAPYAQLHEFSVNIINMLDLHVPTREEAGDFPPSRFVPVPTYTLFMGQDREMMLDFSAFMVAFNQSAAARSGWHFNHLNDLITAANTTPELLYLRDWYNRLNVQYFNTRGIRINPTTFAISPMDDPDVPSHIPMGEQGYARDVLRGSADRAPGIIAIVDFPEHESYMFDPVMWTWNTGFGLWPDEFDGRHHGFTRYPMYPGFFAMMGFDQNQTYYGAMMTQMALYPPGMPYPPSPLRPEYGGVWRFFSDLTGIETLTTPGDHMPIDPDDLAPDRPLWDEERLFANYDYYVADTWATLHFIAREEESETYFTAYEILRTRVPLDDSLLNLNVHNFRRFFDDHTDPMDEGRAGFRWSMEGLVDDEDYMGRWFTGTDWANRMPFDQWNITRDGAPMADGRQSFRFHDQPLVPNTVYFYYVRSVRVRTFYDAYGERIGTEDVAFSIWDPISVTTSVISAPMNLRVVRLPDFPFDARTEMVLQFELLTDHLHGFTRELSIREGDGDWFVHPYWSTIHISEPFELYGEQVVTVTIQVHYLTPATDYSFRIRSFDPLGRPSQWSNTAFGRTDFDQGIFEDDRNLNFWIDFIRRYLWYYFRRNYWPLIMRDDHAMMLYRYSRISQIVWEPVDSQIFIYTGIRDAVCRLEILLPIALVDEANRNNMSFVIRNGQLETVIPPGAFSAVMPGAREAAQDTDPGPAEDFYIMIAIDYSHLSQNPVDSHDLAERNADIRVQAMSSRMTARQLDNNILWQVTHQIEGDDIFYEVSQVILSMLRQNVSSEDIAFYAYGVIYTLRHHLMADALRMYTEHSHLAHTVRAFNRPIYHALQTNDSWDVVLGYVAHEAGFYSRSETRPFRDGVAVSLPGPASVLFTIHNALTVVPGLVYEVYMPGHMADLIARYNLSDLVGGSPAGAATHSLFMNAIARISGQGHDVDGVAFMRSRGYGIAGRTPSSPVTWQEAAYFIVALYEIRTGTNSDAVQIRNHAVTAAMSGVDQRFVRSIQVAFELGVMNDPHVNPNEVITVMDMLNMISRLNTRLGL